MSMMSSPLSRRGHARSYVTLPEYRRGMTPANAGKRYPAETYTRDEMHTLMSALGRGAAGDRNRALLVMMWRCGLRIAEALDLYEKDLDFDRAAVTILHGKGDKRRVVGIDPEAAAVVQRWLARRRTLGISSRRYVFCVISQGPSLGQKMYASCAREAFKDAAVRGGICGREADGSRWGKRVHPHGMRHTFACELARERVPLPIIQHLLGHSDLRTTQRYVSHMTHWEAIDVIRQRTWPTASGGSPAAGPADVTEPAA